MEELNFHIVMIVPTGSFLFSLFGLTVKCIFFQKGLHIQSPSSCNLMTVSCVNETQPDLPTSGVEKLYSLIPKVVFYWQQLYFKNNTDQYLLQFLHTGRIF